MLIVLEAITLFLFPDIQSLYDVLFFLGRSIGQLESMFQDQLMLKGQTLDSKYFYYVVYGLPSNIQYIRHDTLRSEF